MNNDANKNIQSGSPTQQTALPEAQPTDEGWQVKHPKTKRGCVLLPE